MRRRVAAGGLAAALAVKLCVDALPEAAVAVAFLRPAARLAAFHLGAAYDPRFALTNAAQRLADAKRMSRLVRRHFPDWRITLGNSLCSTEIIAEMMRAGFPKDGADCMGLEHIGRTVLPEKEWDGGLQAADWMRTTARHFGYDWKPNACFESNYRRDAVLGADRQAAWYVRDPCCPCAGDSGTSS